MKNNNIKEVCIISDTVIGYFDSKITNPSGGRERQIYLLANELEKLDDYEISIITGDFGQSNNITINGVKFHKEKINVSGNMNYPKKFFRVQKAMDVVDADIYYIRGSPTLTVAAWLYCQTHRKGLIHCVSGDTLIDPNYISNKHTKLRQVIDKFYIKVLKRTDEVVTLTDRQSDILKGEYGIESKKIPVCHQFPPWNELNSYCDRDGVFWAGRITENTKRPRSAIQLAKKLPKIKFTLAGMKQEGEEELYEEIINDSSELDNVEFLGRVDPEDMHMYYNSSLAFLQTTDTEGIGNTTIESWSYGTPVISLYSSLDGLASSNKIAKYGEKNIEVAKRKTKDLLHDKWSWEEHHRNCRRFSEENYSIDRLRRNYTNIIDKVS